MLWEMSKQKTYLAGTIQDRIIFISAALYDESTMLHTTPPPSKKTSETSKQMKKKPKQKNQTTEIKNFFFSILEKDSEKTWKFFNFY